MSGILEVYQSGAGIAGSFDDHRVDIDPERTNKKPKKPEDNNNNNENSQATDTQSAHQSALDALKQNAQELSHSSGSSSPLPLPPDHNVFKHFLQQHSHSLGSSEPEEHDELWDKVYKEHNFKDKKGKKSKGKAPINTSANTAKPALTTSTPVEKAAVPLVPMSSTSNTASLSTATAPPKKKKGKGKGKKRLHKEVEMDNLSDLEKGAMTEEAHLDFERAERVMDYRTCGCLFATAFLLCIILFNLPHN